MNPTQQVLNYQKEINENQIHIRDMVLESYGDIALGKGRDCNKFFNELEKKYSGAKI